MRLKNLVNIFLIMIFASVFIRNTNALYLTGIEKKTEVYIAKPICRAIVENKIFISNYSEKPYYFSICNYDEQNNISETAMSYYIIFHTNQTNTPLEYKLYKINNDKSEEISLEITDNIIKTKEKVLMNIDNKHKDDYKLEIGYNLKSKNELNKDFKISMELYSEQYFLK